MMRQKLLPCQTLAAKICYCKVMVSILNDLTVGDFKVQNFFFSALFSHSDPIFYFTYISNFCIFIGMEFTHSNL